MTFEPIQVRTPVVTAEQIEALNAASAQVMAEMVRMAQQMELAMRPIGEAMRQLAEQVARSASDTPMTSSLSP